MILPDTTFVMAFQYLASPSTGAPSKTTSSMIPWESVKREKAEQLRFRKYLRGRIGLASAQKDAVQAANPWEVLSTDLGLGLHGAEPLRFETGERDRYSL